MGPAPPHSMCVWKEVVGQGSGVSCPQREQEIHLQTEAKQSKLPSEDLYMEVNYAANLDTGSLDDIHFYKSCVLISFKELTGVCLVSFPIHQQTELVEWYHHGNRLIRERGVRRIKDTWNWCPTESRRVISLLSYYLPLCCGVLAWAWKEHAGSSLWCEVYPLGAWSHVQGTRTPYWKVRM